MRAVPVAMGFARILRDSVKTCSAFLTGDCLVAPRFETRGCTYKVRLRGLGTS